MAKFTNINLFPKGYIADETLIEEANLALGKTHKYSLVANSVNAAVFYHSEVLINPYPKAVLMKLYEVFIQRNPMK